MIPLTKSSRYRNFVGERNRALQDLLNKKLSVIDGYMNVLKKDVVEIAAQMSFSRNGTPQEFLNRIEPLVRYTAANTIRAAMAVRRLSYTLSYAGELEATARTTGKSVRAELGRERMAKMLSEKAPSGGDLGARIVMYFDRLSRNLADAYQTSRVLEETAEEYLERVAAAFPRVRIIVRPKPRLAKPVREAKSPTRRPVDSLIAGFIDDDLWDEVVQAYLDDIVPTGRGPEDTVKVGKEKVERYTWEVEKEITEDFVQLVRKGQIDAAKENGIKDFVWIAVVDDRTDECCLWRDGLSTQEISRQLAGKRSGDECQSTVPPAHFNCRCDLAPMTEEIPEKGPEGLGDFETWLTTK